MSCRSCSYFILLKFRSGVDLVDERYPCQHTTCRACHLIVTPSCPKCPEPVKKRCLRHYYLCIEEHFKRNDAILVSSTHVAIFGTITMHAALQQYCGTDNNIFVILASGSLVPLRLCGV